MALDCWDPDYTTPTRTASATWTTSTRTSADSRWPFFEYLTEKYGASLHRPGALRRHAKLARRPRPHCSTRSPPTARRSAAAYNAWTTADLTRQLQRSAPPRARAGVVHEAADRRRRIQTAPRPADSAGPGINHLSTRTSSSTAATASDAAACYAATLTLDGGDPGRKPRRSRSSTGTDVRGLRTAGAADGQRQHGDRDDPVGHVHVDGAGATSRCRTPPPASTERRELLRHGDTHGIDPTTPATPASPPAPGHRAGPGRPGDVAVVAPDALASSGPSC